MCFLYWALHADCCRSHQPWQCNIILHNSFYSRLPLQPNEKLLYPEADSFHKSLQRALFLLQVLTHCLGFYPTKFPSIPGEVWPQIPSPVGVGGTGYGSAIPYKGDLFCTGGTANNTSFHSRYAECSSSKTLMSRRASWSSYATLTAVNWGDSLRRRETRQDGPLDTGHVWREGM